jgi:hypothetical protein
MDALRTRVSSAAEWAVAVTFLAATLWVGSLLYREFRATQQHVRLPASSSVSIEASPAAVPARAISVPMLLLLDGKEIRVGDSVDAVALRLGRSAETGAQHLDHGPRGERMTRFYEHEGTRFILVFEPANAAPEAKVAAIYLH